MSNTNYMCFSCEHYGNVAVCDLCYEEKYYKRRKITMPVNRKETERKEPIYIENVVFNYPATIVFWSDHTKSVVKCQDDEVYDPEKGLAMAIVKKLTGNKGSYYNIFKSWVPDAHIDDSKDWLTPKEVAEKTHYTESYIRKLIRNGKYPGAVKRDGKWLIPACDVD